MNCASCGNIPFEWVVGRWGTVNEMACPDCKPLPPHDAMTEVMGAVLYDEDGSLRHWERASKTLTRLARPGIEAAIVSWMACVASEGKAPGIVEVMTAMGPERCVQPIPWMLRAMLADAASAEDFDAALVRCVRQANRRREAA